MCKNFSGNFKKPELKGDLLKLIFFKLFYEVEGLSS